MPKNRVIYAAEAVYVSPSPGTGALFFSGNSGANLVSQLYRVQSANYGYNIARQDVNQFGELAAIDRVILVQPSVNLDISWLQNNFVNERNLGFTISSGVYSTAISGMLNKTSDEKNYFIKTVGEGVDAVGQPVGTNAFSTNEAIIAIGNGFMNSYTSEASVGNFPKASVSVEGLNINFDNPATISGTPALNPTDGTPVGSWFYRLPATTSDSGSVANLGISVLRPGDITVTIAASAGGAAMTEGGSLFSDAKLQSYQLQIPLSRTPLLKLGNKYAFSREVNFPINTTINLTANVGDLATNGSLTGTVNNNTDYNITVNMNQPGTSTTAIQYVIRNANLVSQNFTSSVSNSKTVTWQFMSPLGGNSSTGVGIFFSGLN